MHGSQPLSRFPGQGADGFLTFSEILPANYLEFASTANPPGFIPSALTTTRKIAMTCRKMLVLLCTVSFVWSCVPLANTTSPEAQKTLDVHYQLGIKYLAEGKTPQAMKEFMTAQAISAKNSDVEHALGLAYQQKGLYDQAIFQYQKAITLDPKLTEARNNMGTAYLSKGMYKEAMAEFEECLNDTSYGTPDKAAYNLGFAYLKQDNLDKAIEYYQKAIQLNSENPNPFYYLGLCYQQKENFPTAIENYKKVVALDESFQDTYFRLGTLYEKQNNQAKAMAALKKAVELDSSNLTALLRLGIVMLRLGQTDEGLKSLELVAKGDESGALAKEATQEIDRVKAGSKFNGSKFNGSKFKGIPKVSAH
jgi:type IV pilus biogenesis/stability protein PilW